MAKIHDSDFSKRPQRKFGLKRIFIISLFVVLALVGLGIPLALQNRNFVVSMANNYAGLAPMRIDLSSIECGWFRPIKIRGLRLVDEQGAELVQVAEVETELTLLNAMTNYRNLKTVTIRGASVHLDVQPGTTNIEQALKPFLDVAPAQNASVPTSTSTAIASPFVGRIRIADAVVHARDSVDLTSWDFILKQADLPLAYYGATYSTDEFGRYAPANDSQTWRSLDGWAVQYTNATFGSAARQQPKARSYTTQDDNRHQWTSFALVRFSQASFSGSTVGTHCWLGNHSGGYGTAQSTTCGCTNPDSTD
jgi:hypothetical protein